MDLEEEKIGVKKDIYLRTQHTKSGVTFGDVIVYINQSFGLASSSVVKIMKDQICLSACPLPSIQSLTYLRFCDNDMW